MIELQPFAATQPGLIQGFTQLDRGGPAVPPIGLLLSMSALGSAAIGLIFLVRHHDQVARDTDRQTFRLEFPPGLSHDSVTAVLRGLTGLRPPAGWLLGRDSVVFELHRHGGVSEYAVRLPRRHHGHLLTQLHGLVPGLRAIHIRRPAVPTVTLVQELALTGTAASLRTDQARTFAGSLLHVLAAPDGPKDEAIVYQVVAYPLGTTELVPAGPAWPVARHRPAGSGSAAATTKTDEPLFGVTLRLGARTASPARGRRLVRQMRSALYHLERPGATFATWRQLRPGAAGRLHRAATSITVAPVHVNARELAALLAWPLAGLTVPGLALSGGRLFPPSAELPATGRVYGRATYPGLERPVAVAAADARMHTLIIGPTGSGKTTLMLNLITQDLAAGNGVVLIDPNVGLARDVIARIPKERVRDLIYLDPADELAVPLNPLDCAPEDAELVADQVLELIRDRSLSWGVTIEELLRNALVLLAASPNMTLTEVSAVLRDSAFRTHLLARLDAALQPTVGEFFRGFEARSPQQQAQDAAAVLNKVSPLVDRRPIRAMLGQAEATWTMRQVVDEGKLLVVALPSGVIGPLAADIIGATVVRLVWNAVLARTAVAPSARRPVSLYLDELPRFVGRGADVADLLARARALGLDLVGAVQHLAQVPPRLAAALLSEARNKVIFQPAEGDARLLARHLPGVRPEDLLGLPARTAVAALVAGGRVTGPVTIAMAAPPPESGQGPAARAVARSHGRSRREVEAAIHQRRQVIHAGPRRTRRLP